MAKHNKSGSEAENRVAGYLHKAGYKILDTNWKTKWCEIDIVVKRGRTIYFVEVKYRRSSNQGSGLEYITQAKLKKMQLAAHSWVEMNAWDGEYVLSAAEVSGGDFDVQFVKQI